MTKTLSRLGPALALAALVSGCRRPPDRAVVLEGIGTNVVLPSYARLSATAEALARAAHQLDVSADDSNLRATQQAWRAAIAALSYTYPLRFGPMGDLRLHIRQAYWPIRSSAIDALIDGSTDPAPRVEKAGAAAKGLFAIESLLFDDATATPILTSAPHRKLLAALAVDYQRAAKAVEGAAIEKGFPKQLAGQGQQGIGLVVNGMIEAVETARAALDTAAGQSRGTRTPSRTGGTRSGSVGDIARARIEGVSALYLGAPAGGDSGLTSLVRALAPAVDGQIRDALRATLESVTAEQCRKLEVTMKAGLLSALGVTLTFHSTDGD